MTDQPTKTPAPPVSKLIEAIGMLTDSAEVSLHYSPIIHGMDGAPWVLNVVPLNEDTRRYPGRTPYIALYEALTAEAMKLTHERI